MYLVGAGAKWERLRRAYGNGHGSGMPRRGPLNSCHVRGVAAGRRVPIRIFISCRVRKSGSSRHFFSPDAKTKAKLSIDSQTCPPGTAPVGPTGPLTPPGRVRPVPSALTSEVEKVGRMFSPTPPVKTDGAVPA